MSVAVTSESTYIDNERLRRIASFALTWLEQQEAQAVRFGVFTPSMTGQEFINEFSQRSVDNAPCQEREISHALRLLRETESIVLLDTDPDRPDVPAGWLFRSRSAELVRLLANLRQRFVGQNVVDAPALVSDLIWEVQQRQYATRNIPLEQYIAPLAPEDGEIVEAALLCLWDQALIKRNLESSAAAIPLDEDDDSDQALRRPKYSAFQTRAMQFITATLSSAGNASDRKGLVVEAGTGSGKTYSFLLPLLGYLARVRMRQGLEGCKAILVYPRQPLAENQFQAIVNVVYHLNREPDPAVPGGTRLRNPSNQVKVGLLYGRTPYSYGRASNFEEKARRWEKVPGQPNAFYCPFARCPKCGGRLIARPGQQGDLGRNLRCEHHGSSECSTGPDDLNFIRYAREDYRRPSATQTPPDIMVCVTESLNTLLGSSAGSAMFGKGVGGLSFTIPQLVMLDEIHLQTGSKGVQISYLLRRLLARLEQNRRRRGEGNPGYGHPDQAIAPIMAIGLSATLHHGRDFFARLFGIERNDVERVTPDSEAGELELGDAEHFLFVKANPTAGAAVLSTAIQTTMLLTHGQAHPEFPEPPYRTFGFADSLDMVNRWYNDQRDTEKPKRGGPPLFALRYPDVRENADAYKPLPAFPCHECMSQEHPNRMCAAHQDGECWWPVMKGGFAKRLNIQKTTSQTRSFGSQAHLVLATSKLEVGFDDDRLMTVVQFRAPRDVASFVQRKGRGGRQVGTRPIMATVLDPGRPTDAYYFRNTQRLTDPVFRKLPLNPLNALARQIHSIFGLFDWVANGDGSIAVGKLTPRDWEAIKRAIPSEQVVDDFRAYIATIWGTDPDDLALLELFTGPEGLLQEVISDLHRSLLAAGDGQRLVNLLPTRIPPTLFSEIHLPLVQVVDRMPSPNRPFEVVEAMDIGMALRDLMPGRITMRWEGPKWVPVIAPEPASAALPSRLNVEPWYSNAGDARLEWSEITTIHWKEVPRRWRVRLGTTQLQQKIAIKRPMLVHVEDVADQGGEPLWTLDYANQDASFRGDGPKIHLKSNSNAVRFTSIDAPDAAVFSAQSVVSPDRLPGRRSLTRDLGNWFSAIRFALCSEGTGLRVLRSTVGAEYDLMPLRSSQQTIRNTVAFTDSDGKWVGLGFSGESDGIEFALQRGWSGAASSRFKPSTHRMQFIRDAVFRYEVPQRVLERGRVNTFTLSYLVEVALAYLGGPPELRPVRLDRFSADVLPSEVESELVELFNGLFQQPKPTYLADFRALVKEAEIRRVIATVYQEAFDPKISSLILQYQEDLLRHTLKHALKASVKVVAGAVDIGEIAGHTKLVRDYPDTSSANEPQPITIFEVGQQGVGIVRALHEELRGDPSSFLYALTDLVEGCETARDESWLRELLGYSESQLAVLASVCLAATAAEGYAQRQAQLRNVASVLQAVCGHPVPDWAIRATMRAFSSGLTANLRSAKHRIEEWRLLREINLTFLASEEDRLGRPISSREARYSLRKQVEARVERFPELAKLRSVLATAADGAGPGDDEDEEFDTLDGYGSSALNRRLEEAIERRLLISCRTACPSCLQDQDCDIDSSPLGRHLVDRHLLVELLEHTRNAEAVELEQGASRDAVITGIRKRFTANPMGVARLRYYADDWEQVDAALRDIMAFGLEIELRRRRVAQLGDRNLADGRIEVLLEVV